MDDPTPVSNPVSNPDPGASGCTGNCGDCGGPLPLFRAPARQPDLPAATLIQALHRALASSYDGFAVAAATALYYVPRGALLGAARRALDLLAAEGWELTRVGPPLRPTERGGPPGQPGPGAGQAA